MWSFAWVFWVIPLLFFCGVARHRWHERRSFGSPRTDPRLERELYDQREYVDGLERRIAELEERLDFTERLLAQRNQVVPGPV